jgi:hypothetical protein
VSPISCFNLNSTLIKPFRLHESIGASGHLILYHIFLIREEIGHFKRSAALSSFPKIQAFGYKRLVT